MASLSRSLILVCNGPRDVSVNEVPNTKIERPTDALVKVASTNIRGSDLHMYDGRTDMQLGRILDHENFGCAFCANLEKGLSGHGFLQWRAGGIASRALWQADGVILRPMWLKFLSARVQIGVTLKLNRLQEKFTWSQAGGS